MKKIHLRSVLVNVAPAFRKATWRQSEIGRYFTSVKEMSKMYNVRNCNYDVEDEDGEVIRTIRNGKIDCYGRRFS